MQTEILPGVGIAQVRDPEPERMGMKHGNLQPPQDGDTDLDDLARALIPDRPAQRPDPGLGATAEQRDKGTAHARPRVQLVAQGLRERGQVGGGPEGAAGAAAAVVEDGGLEALSGLEFGPGVEVVDAVKGSGEGVGTESIKVHSGCTRGGGEQEREFFCVCWQILNCKPRCGGGLS